ncbi:MAG: hypothetical protein QOH69_1637 [Actinomycetota bacterium]|jgi:hypothetical protein|nr:hypothetical protein [Actinomycetota bacterium]
MSEAGEFIDAALQYEVSPYSYPSDESDGLLRYGTSIGAIRGTIRDALKRYSGMSHDDITALSSELWSAAVFERRQAAIILLQAHVEILVANDLTRIEGFIRSAGSHALVDQLVADVVRPMLTQMDASTLARVQTVLERWATEPSATLSAVGRGLGASTLQ